MNVSLPDPMKAWLEVQAQTGRYSNASDYVRDPIRRDQEQADRVAALRRYLDEASGTSSRSVTEIVAEAACRVSWFVSEPDQIVILRSGADSKALMDDLIVPSGFLQCCSLRNRGGSPAPAPYRAVL